MDEKKETNIEVRLLHQFQDISKVVQPLMDMDFLSPYIVNRQEHNPQTLDYCSTRYLDAWAKLINIHKPCSAVVRPNINENKLYVAFNETQKSQIKVINIINMISANNPSIEEMFAVTFLFNADANKFSKELKSLPGIIIKTVKDIDDWKNFFEQNTDQINEISDKENFVEVANEIKRNITKLKEHKLLNFQIECIKNNEGFHAEIAAAKFLMESRQALQENYDDKQDVNSEYIGVSKLSCFICHETLNLWEFNHRGTHGKLYMNKYVFYEKLEDDFINKIIQNILEYFGQNFNEACQRVISYDKIFYDNRVKETAICSDDECWEVQLSGTD